MKYRAIISDIDGTIMAIDPNAVPNDNITRSIKKCAKNGAYFCLASGRPFEGLEHLAKLLDLKSPIICDNGALIVNSGNGSILWEKTLTKEKIADVIDFAKSTATIHLSTDCGIYHAIDDVPADAKIRKAAILDIEEKSADFLIDRMRNEFKDIAIGKAASFEGPDFADVYLSHPEATKQHAVLKVAKVLGISVSEIIGVGDGHNDFSLLMACGLKVAMGNAVEDLKAIADYIAPSVENDGMADIIEKFIF